MYIHINELHDKTFLGIDFDWKKATIEIKLLNISILLFEVSGFQVERQLPWGFSNSINSAKISRVSENQILELEMQSGDKIIITFKTSNLIS